MNEFNTGWDPYDELMLHRHNIDQMILAINQGSELTKQLGYKYNHQQEVIQQLMFQNRRLNQLLEIHRNELNQLRLRLDQTEKPQ